MELAVLTLEEVIISGLMLSYHQDTLFCPWE